MSRAQPRPSLASARSSSASSTLRPLSASTWRRKSRSSRNSRKRFATSQVMTTPVAGSTLGAASVCAGSACAGGVSGARSMAWARTSCATNGRTANAARAARRRDCFNDNAFAYIARGRIKLAPTSAPWRGVLSAGAAISGQPRDYGHFRRCSWQLCDPSAGRIHKRVRSRPRRVGSEEVAQGEIEANQQEADGEDAHEHRRADVLPAPLSDSKAEAGRRERDHRAADQRQRQRAFARQRNAERDRGGEERESQRLDELVPLQSKRLEVRHEGQDEHPGHDGDVAGDDADQRREPPLRARRHRYPRRRQRQDRVEDQYDAERYLCAPGGVVSEEACARQAADADADQHRPESPHEGPEPLAGERLPDVGAEVRHHQEARRLSRRHYHGEDAGRDRRQAEPDESLHEAGEKGGGKRRERERERQSEQGCIPSKRWVMFEPQLGAADKRVQASTFRKGP